MTEPSERLADVAVSATQRAEKAEAQLNDPQALQARLKELEAEATEERLETLHGELKQELKDIDEARR